MSMADIVLYTVTLKY